MQYSVERHANLIDPYLHLLEQIVEQEKHPLSKAGLTATQIGSLLSGGATTVGGLLQQQTSREAAQKAQQMIEAETAAAKTAAQFRPVGMTTRFGTSQSFYEWHPKPRHLQHHHCLSILQCHQQHSLLHQRVHHHQQTLDCWQ